MLALAHHWRSLIRAGVVLDQAALARLVGVSRARVTQVMDLLYLAPEIQEEVLDANDSPGGPVSHTERDLRRIAALLSWPEQRTVLNRVSAPR
jgi:hypothetical protein